MSGVAGMQRYRALRATARARMWQSMRIMRRFSARDLAATAECSQSSAEKYVRALRQAGYVRIVQASNYRPMGHTVFQLLRDSGPATPLMRKRQPVVWDPNNAKRYSRDGGDA